jgi:hypothetical protein
MVRQDGRCAASVLQPHRASAVRPRLAQDPLILAGAQVVQRGEVALDAPDAQGCLGGEIAQARHRDGQRIGAAGATGEGEEREEKPEAQHDPRILASPRHGNKKR